MAEFSEMVSWEDEYYADIKIGDKVYYKNKQGQIHRGEAVLYGPAGWVLSCDHGTQVVQDGINYMGHTPTKDPFRTDDHMGKWLNKWRWKEFES